MFDFDFIQDIPMLLLLSIGLVNRLAMGLVTESNPQLSSIEEWEDRIKSWEGGGSLAQDLPNEYG